MKVQNDIYWAWYAQDSFSQEGTFKPSKKKWNVKIKLFDICQEKYFWLFIFLLFFCVKIRNFFCVFRLWSYWCPYILYRPIGHVSQRTIYPNIVLMPMMIDFAPASLVQKWNIHKLYSMQSLQKIKRLVFVVFDILYLCVWWPGNAFFKL